MQCFARIVGILVGVIVLLWIGGILLSDRWMWSQWVAWIPTPLLMFLLLFSSVLFFISNKKFVGIFLLLLTITVSSWFCFVEHRMLGKSHQTGDVTIVGWTMSHSKKAVAEESAQKVVDLHGDITLLTHGWYVRGHASIHDWLKHGGYKVTDSQFTLLTMFEPLFVQTIIASDGIYISSFILDTTEVLGDVLVVWGIDLPSSIWDSKMDVAYRVQRLLQTIEHTPPDIVIGDFNMTSNSVAIKTMFPTLRDVSRSVGVGLLASFPMNFPMYHIDHTLMSARFSAVKYELVNPHIGRHQIQIVEIKAHAQE